MALMVTLVVAMTGCGAHTKSAPPPPAKTHVDDGIHGLAFDLPSGWNRATTSLTPTMTDPREELAVANYPLHYRPGKCAHMASSALEALPRGGAFLTLMERGLDRNSDWSDFPARPAHFGPELGGPSEAAACAPGGHFTDHWFGITDGGRHFHVDVAFGPDATQATQQQAWSILDSLRVDPKVRPDWESSG